MGNRLPTLLIFVYELNDQYKVHIAYRRVKNISFEH